MEYRLKHWKGVCPQCQLMTRWSAEPDKEVARFDWTCSKCETLNRFRPLPEWPDVPRSLHIGADWNNLLKIYPVPPEIRREKWADPYSIRTFVHQCSREKGGCQYHCSERGTVFDEPVYNDFCYDPDADCDHEEPQMESCHILAGWAGGRNSCRLWEQIQKLCQTSAERRFLHDYIRFVKDRQFPMLIPQPWIGIGARRRPDFLAFVPITFWQYKKVAIELDAGHREEQAVSDSARNDFLRQNGYEVYSVRDQSLYFHEVRSLVEKFESWMQMARTNPFDVAFTVDIYDSQPPDEDRF